MSMTTMIEIAGCRDQFPSCCDCALTNAELIRALHTEGFIHRECGQPLNGSPVDISVFYS